MASRDDVRDLDCRMKTTSHHEPRSPIVGVLGGGQLAQMLSQAATPLGITINILAPDLALVLPGLREGVVIGDWNDPETVVRFCQHVDVLTLENEFVPPACLNAVEASGVACFPTPASLRLIQDKWTQKRALLAAGVSVVACDEVKTPVDVAEFAHRHGWPVVLKRRHLGYDGKGNATLRSADEIPMAWKRLAGPDHGLYVEAFCPFDRELAVMVCRDVSGQTVTYPVVDTVQRDHICHIVRAPSQLAPDQVALARERAVAAVIAIGGVGCFGVEMFLTAEGEILVNELAPRVHNSGHYSIEACACSQFENHLRAVLGWPLGDARLRAPAAVMVNLLGQADGPGHPAGLAEALSVAGAHIHLYGKARSMPGRKMGHVTALGSTVEEAEAIAAAAARSLYFGRRPA